MHENMIFVAATGAFSRAGEVELRGDVVAMGRIAELLRGRAEEQVRVDLQCADSEATPYDGFLKFLDIEIRNEEPRIKVVIERDALRVVGSSDMMKILAENIEMLIDDVKRSGVGEKHLHIEYHPDHYYLDSSSAPLVLTVEQPRGTVSGLTFQHLC